MKKVLVFSLGLAFALTFTACGSKKKIDVSKVFDKNCSCCMEDVVKENRYIAGLLKYSNKAKTMRLKINKTSVLVKLDADTKFEGTDGIGSIKKNTCMMVDYKTVGEDMVAVKVKVLPPLADRIKENLVETAFMEKLIDRIPPALDNALVVDSRPEFAYIKGTIPGAVNIPYPKLKKEKDITKLLGADKNKQIVFFCGGLHCNLAPGSAIHARKAGYTNIKVYHLGFPEWRKTGHPVCLKQAGLKTFMKKGLCIILIDLRKNAAAGHIPGAINILPKDIAKWQKRFPDSSQPDNKVAPIIVYLENNKHKGDVSPVMKTIFSWGFRNVAVLDGGFEGYKAAGGKVAQNKLQNKIFYTKQLEPGEVFVRDFVAKVKKPGENEAILDVRPADEFEANHIPGAVNVPVTEFNKAKAKELETYKTLYVYCNSGVLASLFYEKAEKFGLKNVKWVKTRVTYEDGKINLGRHEKFVIPQKK